MAKHRIVCDCNAKTKWDSEDEGIFGTGEVNHPSDDKYNRVCPHCALFHWYEDDDGKPVPKEEEKEG